MIILKKCFVVLLSLVLLFSSLACQKDNSEETIKGLTWENEYIKEELATVKADLKAAEEKLASANAELTAYRNATPAPVITPEPLPTPEPEIVEKEVLREIEVPGSYAFGVNCLLNGAKMLSLNGDTAVTAVPALPEGMIFESWKVNGEPAGSAAELRLSLKENTLVEALYHPEKKITCINCFFQFPNAKVRAAGDKLETVSFEFDYTNPVTKASCPGGSITGFVIANVPKKKAVDYWIINGVEYHFNNEVKSFRIVDQKEPTTYEVVFKNASTKKSTDKRDATDPTPKVMINNQSSYVIKP